MGILRSGELGLNAGVRLVWGGILGSDGKGVWVVVGWLNWVVRYAYGSDRKGVGFAFGCGWWG